jgi:hypothetical protein
MEYGNHYTKVEQELREMKELNDFMRYDIIMEYAKFNMNGEDFAKHCLASWRGHSDYDDYASEKFHKFTSGRDTGFSGEAYKGLLQGILNWYFDRIPAQAKEVK